MGLRLKPQDLVVALKLVAQADAEWTQPELARSLHLSASEVNHGLTRSVVGRDAPSRELLPFARAGRENANLRVDDGYESNDSAVASRPSGRGSPPARAARCGRRTSGASRRGSTRSDQRARSARAMAEPARCRERRSGPRGPAPMGKDSNTCQGRGAVAVSADSNQRSRHSPAR